MCLVVFVHKTYNHDEGQRNKGNAMRLKYLYYFKRLTELSSFTKAAEDLHIAQPTLSAVIRRMEQELEVELINRDSVRTGVELTESGEVFYEYICQALSTYEKGVVVARNSDEKAQNELNLGVNYAMQSQFFSDALAEYEAASQFKVKIELRQGYSANLLKLLRRGKIDVTFASRVKGAEDLVYEHFWAKPLIVGVNKSHPLASKKSLTIDDLRLYTLVSYNKQSPAYENITLFAKENNLSISCRFEEEISIAAYLLGYQDAVALFCYSYLLNAFDDVVCIPIEGVDPNFHELCLVTRNEEHSDIVNEFLNHMRGYSFPVIQNPEDYQTYILSKADSS